MRALMAGTGLALAYASAFAAVSAALALPSTAFAAPAAASAASDAPSAAFAAVPAAAAAAPAASAAFAPSAAAAAPAASAAFAPSAAAAAPAASAAFAPSAASAAFAPSAASAAAPAAAPAGESRLVAFELREGGRLVGAPSLSVRLGEPATIMTGGPGGYKVELILERADGAADYFIRSGIYRPDGAGWSLVGSPSLTVAAGEQGRVMVRRDAGDPGYSVAFTVR